MFYRSRRNLWGIPEKFAICNTLNKNKFVTGVVQRVRLDFKQRTIVLKFLEHLFHRTYSNECVCPYRMKLLSLLLSFRSLPTISPFTHFFGLENCKYNVLNVNVFFLYFFVICNPVYSDYYLILNKSGSFTKKNLFFTKCFSYLFSKQLLPF